MLKLFKRLIELGRNSYVPNEEQFVSINYYVCSPPLTGVVNNSKYFGGNRSVAKVRKRNG